PSFSEADFSVSPISARRPTTSSRTESMGTQCRKFPTQSPVGISRLSDRKNPIYSGHGIVRQRLPGRDRSVSGARARVVEHVRRRRRRRSELRTRAARGPRAEPADGGSSPRLHGAPPRPERDGRSDEEAMMASGEGPYAKVDATATPSRVALRAQ